MTERIWTILAAVMAIIAAACVWRNNMSAAFVTATLGAVAWFLSYRAQIQAKRAASEVDPNEAKTNEEANQE